MSMARSTPAQNDRGLASRTSRGRMAAAQASRAGTVRRNERSAAQPSTTVPGRTSDEPTVSEMARTTANGEPSAGASQADSMSTAMASPQPDRSRPVTSVALDTRGPQWTVRPSRRSDEASSGADGQATVDSPVLTSVATTTSPTATPGTRPPPTPATSRGPASFFAAARDRCRPMPVRRTGVVARRRAACSTRSGAAMTVTMPPTGSGRGRRSGRPAGTGGS